MHDKETVELALLGLSEGISVTEVARELGIHKATVSRWGSGRLPHSATGKPVDSSHGDRATGRRKAVEKKAEKRAAGGARDTSGMTEEELRAFVRDLEPDVAILEQEVEILKKPRRRPRGPHEQ